MTPLIRGSNEFRKWSNVKAPKMNALATVRLFSSGAKISQRIVISPELKGDTPINPPAPVAPPPFESYASERGAERYGPALPRIDPQARHAPQALPCTVIRPIAIHFVLSDWLKSHPSPAHPPFPGPSAGPSRSPILHFMLSLGPFYRPSSYLCEGPVRHLPPCPSAPSPLPPSRSRA